jgi:hypothetical protein
LPVLGIVGLWVAVEGFEVLFPDDGFFVLLGLEGFVGGLMTNEGACVVPDFVGLLVGDLVELLPLVGFLVGDEVLLLVGVFVGDGVWPDENATKLKKTKT